jgi:hypothetical protein
MIVVAIIGIIAAIAIPAYNDYKLKQNPDYIEKQVVISDFGKMRSEVLINELFDDVTNLKSSCDVYDDTGYYYNGDYFICSISFNHIVKLNDKYETKSEVTSIKCLESELKKCYIN